MRRLLLSTTVPLFAMGCLLSSAGCGGSDPVIPTEEVMSQTAIADVGEALRAFQANNGEPPKTAAELVGAQGMDMLAPIGMKAISDDEVVVFWGTTLPDTMEVALTEEGQDTVLAYESQVPESGGLVLMVDRSVKSMTAEEFQAAPKAGTVPAAAN